MGLIYSYSGIYEIDPNKKSSIFIFKNSFVTVTYSDFCRKMLEIFGFLFYIFLIISFRNYKAISIELMKKKKPADFETNSTWYSYCYEMAWGKEKTVIFNIQSKWRPLSIINTLW